MESKKTDVAQIYNRQEIVEGYDRPHPEGARHIKMFSAVTSVFAMS